MTDTLIKYKRIIAILSGLVVCLIISNYYAYNKLNIQKNDSLDMIELDNELAIDDKPVIIDEADKKSVETSVETLKKALEGDNDEEIKSAIEALQGSAQKLAEAIYKEAQAQEAPPQQNNVLRQHGSFAT